MDKDNFEKIAGRLEKLGFGSDVKVQLQQQMESGVPSFSIQEEKEDRGNKVGYLLNLKRDRNRDYYYFNSTTAALLAVNGKELQEIREHNFPATWYVNAGEMMRMLLHGDKVSVHKKMFNKEGNAYQSYFSIDINGAKDDYGNFPVNSYHENYFREKPFDLGVLLKNLSPFVKELGTADGITKYERMLQAAFLPKATYITDNGVQAGHLSLHPGDREVNILDKQLQVVEKNKLQLPSGHVKEQTQSDSHEVDGEKKKTGVNQQSSWNNRPKGNGPSH